MSRLIRTIASVGAAAALGGGLLAAQHPAAAADTPPATRFAARVQAELPNAQHGVVNEPTTDVDGGQNAAYIAAGDWLRFDDVAFPREFPFNFFKARVASGARPHVTGTVQVRLDSITGPVIGEIAVGNTGGWQSWRTDTVAMTRSVGGVYDVYVTFAGESRADFVNVNWIGFS
ncbi:carbohydrate-binding protein [Spirilliplanes yamanashiensis]|uniref:CBM6 domain-containing protein n=1 Tax=Spirilliplanes yamanashiensis TaxID=42233 RepID=A0A8J4DMI6_9ACTN|nr:carbohydrate-binding protein [Spirilliplanes yamanashiensis]MDP9815252.1 hypothetical protein [Spirilliplanes yamanashiensis]GIJ06478.1 hypothetical protein Sya03_58300 [Spirilliplanes yamanashiensis]